MSPSEPWIRDNRQVILDGAAYQIRIWTDPEPGEDSIWILVQDQIEKLTSLGELADDKVRALWFTLSLLQKQRLTLEKKHRHTNPRHIETREKQAQLLAKFNASIVEIEGIIGGLDGNC